MIITYQHKGITIPDEMLSKKELEVLEIKKGALNNKFKDLHFSKLNHSILLEYLKSKLSS